ncbi:MAG: ribosome-associated translation inhibitor RaiA [bacterium]|nr:ribosome-associated translation inhibitor RaiA [bacterium]
MNVQITGKHIDVTDAMKDYIKKKINKLTRHLRDVIEVSVTLHVERYHHICEINIMADHLQIRGEGDTNDMYTSIDVAVDKIEKQLRRYRDKLQKRKIRGAEAVRESKMTVYDHRSVALEDEARVIVHSDKIPVKPMSVEEAVMQMDLLDQDFLVFKNAISDDINVIYHRRDGNIGLIEP